MEKYMITMLLGMILTFNLACADQAGEDESGGINGVFKAEKKVENFIETYEKACAKIGDFKIGDAILSAADFRYNKNNTSDIIKGKLVKSILETRKNYLKLNFEGVYNGETLKTIQTETCDGSGNCQKVEDPKIDFPIPVVQSCPQDGNPITFNFSSEIGTYTNPTNPAKSYEALKMIVSSVTKRKCSDGTTYEETLNGEIVYSLNHKEFTNKACELLGLEFFTSQNTTNGQSVLYNVTNQPVE